MITQALESDDGRPKTLKEIYAWVEDNYAYYRKVREPVAGRW